MGDPDEPTVKDRPRLNTPTVDLGGPQGTKITEAGGPSAAVAPSAPSAFDPLAERFEHRAELGRGGMGRVDDAYDRALGRPVAIKHMLAASEIDLARFEREAKITARLEHPGIVPIHDAGRSADGTPFYVMRRVDGQPLADLVEKKPLTERLKLVPNLLAACDAAGFAHARSIVHRDIKPTNILVGPFGETLLIDWGLARELESRDLASPAAMPSDPQLTRAGTVAGTPGFMSPEQARGESVDARADVFALGATLFYVLAGELPWHGGSTEMIDHVGAGRPPDWRRLPPEVPPDLRAIVEKAMSPDLATRYPEAGALAADLRRFTLGNLVAAYEYGWFAKVVRFARRHRAAMLVAGVSLVVLAAVALISVRRVLAERDDANAARALAEQRQREARAAADGLLVKHARELVDDDPVEAIAALRTLPADSPSWPEAWAVANAAYLRGVPFGFLGLTDPAAVEISVDSRHAFASGLQSGKLLLFDLETRTKRNLGAFGRVYGTVWFDASHILCADANKITIVDITSGQQRSLPLDKASVWSNRNGRALFLSDRKVFELSDPAGALVEIDRQVDDYAPSPDLKSAVITRGTTRELQTSSGKTYALPALRPNTSVFMTNYIVRDNFMASMVAGVPEAWDVRDGKLVAREGLPTIPNVRAINYVGGRLYAVTFEGMRLLEEKSAPNHLEVTASFQQADGFVLALADGGIWIRDEAGLFTLGKRRTGYMRIDRSLDGRFIIAVTDSNEILVWDLSKIRPTPISLAQGETPFLLGEHAVWIQTPSLGVTRVDRKTGERTQAVHMMGAIAQVLASKDESWTAALDLSDELIIAHDGVPLLDEHHVYAVGEGNNELVYLDANNQLVRWRSGKSEVLTTVHGTPTLIADGSTLAFVGFTDGVWRIDYASKREERASVPAPIDAVSISDDGTCWFVSAGLGYRWDPHAVTPTKLDLGDTVDGVVATETRAVFHGVRLLASVARTGEIRVIAHASRWAAPIGGDRLATVSQQGVVSIVDTATGATFDLPMTHEIGFPLLFARGVIGLVVWHSNRELVTGLLSIDVPSKPAELQRWLAGITNAKPVPGSEAIAWP